MILEELEEFVARIEDFDNLSKSVQIDYIAYFLVLKQSDFSPKDIRDTFNMLNTPQYSNINAYLSNNLKKKFISKTNGKYALTRQLYNELDTQFNNQKRLPLPSNDLFPKEILEGTRKYIIDMGNQAILCFDLGLYDACAVMIRKLLETLIIETFERYKIADKIKNKDDNFPYLSDLISFLLNEKTWNISRNAKTGFLSIKNSGDLSAHNRRYCAKKQDILDTKQAMRICIEELVKLIDYDAWNKELSNKK